MYYKDAEPKETIERIHNLLQSFDISINEIILESIDGIFSVIINISNTSIAANGKGTTLDFAKASAYGELVERLQNFLHFRLFDMHELSDCNVKKYYKNDVYVKEEHEINRINGWASLVFDNHMIKTLHDFIYNSKQKSSRLLSRFVNIENDKDLILVPYTLLDYYYGSNGMASGNTIDEALVQAFSEVVERFTAKKIIIGSSDIKISNITPAIINQFEDINNYIQILSENNIEAVFLDCSQENLFPVIGTLFFDRTNLNYFINFGCHPDLHTAITRSITEFLQGRNVEKLHDMTSFYSDFKNMDKNLNISSIFYNGTGTFPLELFFAPETDLIPTIWEKRYENNSEMVKFYQEVFLKLNKKVYVADRGFLGFQTINLLIPGFSEVALTDTIEELKIIELIKKTNKTYMRLSSGEYKKQDLIEIREFWNSSYISDYTSILSIIRIPLLIKPDKNMELVNKYYINMGISILLEDYTEAYFYAMKWLETNHNYKDYPIYDYVVSITSILYLINSKYNTNQIQDFIKNYGAEDFLQESWCDIIDKNIKNLFVLIPCYNCNECDFFGECRIDNETNLLLNLLTHSCIKS